MYQAGQHILRGNKTATAPHRWIFYDVETIPTPTSQSELKQVFRLGVAYHWSAKDAKRGKWLRYQTVTEFWDWVTQLAHNGERLVLLAHNADFDFRVLRAFSELRKRNYKPVMIIAESPPFIMRFRNGTRTIEILDTLNWFRTSLSKLGDLMKLPKLKMPDYTESTETWFTYCQRDVEILVKFWQQYLEFFRSHDMGTFGRTVAAQAFNWYRHSFMNHEISIHKFPNVTKIERAGYFGGRTECFFIGTRQRKPHYYMDVNSMYPYVMKHFEYPTNYVRLLSFPSITEVKSKLKDYLVIAEVKLKTRSNHFPLVHNNRLTFPSGVFWTTLCTPELKLALKRKDVLKLGKVAFYTKAKLFENWVDELYSLRVQLKSEGNDIYQYFIKIMLNSLYGKFGQRNEQWELVGENDERNVAIEEVYNYDTGEWSTERIVEGQVFASKGKIEATHAFSAISAHVTSYARTVLINYMKKAGRKNVFYCDTDSLICNLSGYRHLSSTLSSSILGALKLEKQALTLQIRNLKDYTFGSSIRRKGVRAGAPEIAPNVFLTETWERFKGALRKKRIDEVFVRKVEKHYSNDYHKGNVQPDGRVTPYVLNEEEYIDFLKKGRTNGSPKISNPTGRVSATN